MQRMRELDDLFSALAKSAFRRRFRLGPAERHYLDEKGLEAVAHHAREFILDRLAPSDPKNDGRQTPMRGHPVFIAQHATGTCCRSCLAKWHGLVQGKPLNDDEIDYVVRVLTAWIERQPPSEAQSSTKTMNHQRQLFD
jgi:hypothetical protein